MHPMYPNYSSSGSLSHQIFSEHHLSNVPWSPRDTVIRCSPSSPSLCQHPHHYCAIHCAIHRHCAIATVLLPSLCHHHCAIAIATVLLPLPLSDTVPSPSLPSRYYSRVGSHSHCHHGCHHSTTWYQLRLSELRGES